MTSRSQSAAPPLSPAVSSTFRATLLWRLENPLFARALDTLGELLWEFVNEGHQFAPPTPYALPAPARSSAMARAVRGALGSSAGRAASA